jgi:hypothetical protein
VFDRTINIAKQNEVAANSDEVCIHKFKTPKYTFDLKDF